MQHLTVTNNGPMIQEKRSVNIINGVYKTDAKICIAFVTKGLTGDTTCVFCEDETQFIREFGDSFEYPENVWTTVVNKTKTKPFINLDEAAPDGGYGITCFRVV